MTVEQRERSQADTKKNFLPSIMFNLPDSEKGFVLLKIISCSRKISSSRQNLLLTLEASCVIDDNEVELSIPITHEEAKMGPFSDLALYKILEAALNYYNLNMKKGARTK